MSTNKTIYHLGPERDKDLFKDLKIIISLTKKSAMRLSAQDFFFQKMKLSNNTTRIYFILKNKNQKVNLCQSR